MLEAEGYVRERTNRNDHPRITVYNTTYWKLAPQSPYCGSAIDWAIRQAGWKHDIDYAPIARYWTLKKKYIIWSRYAGPIGNAKPQRNDVLVFYQNGFWHVALLKDWMEGSLRCKAVDANTSDRGVVGITKPTGKQGVYHEKMRNKQEIYCIVRPYVR